jgi:hypothetical protein
VYKRQYLTLIAKYVCLNCNLNGDGDPRWGFIPAGNGDGEEMLPASVRGDPRGEVFSSRGRGWGAIPRRGIPRCHPYLFVRICLILPRNGSRPEHTYNPIESVHLHYHILGVMKRAKNVGHNKNVSP